MQAKTFRFLASDLMPWTYYFGPKPLSKALGCFGWVVHITQLKDRCILKYIPMCKWRSFVVDNIDIAMLVLLSNISSCYIPLQR
jgi:hypothetical protein